MFFGLLRQLTQRLSVRLAVLFSTIFVVAAAVSFTVLFVLLSHHLKRNDRTMVQAKWKEYEAILEGHGLGALKALILEERLKEGDIPLLVQVVDAKGESELLKVPEDSANALPVIAESLRKVSLVAAWTDIPSPHEADRIDVLTGPLPGGQMFLRVGKSSDPRDDLIENLMHLFLGISALFVLLGSSLGIFFSHRALAPLRDLIVTMHKVRRGSLGSRVPPTSAGGEMGELSSIFNQMLDRVEVLVKGMRETLDNIAHDIRTPLARIRASAELSLREPPGPHDREALEDCAENADAVVQILNSLLNLAEAESGSSALKRELTPVSDLVSPVVDLYDIVAEERSIMVSFQAAIDPGVLVDRARVKQALGNLLDNAIKYSPNGSEIVISVEELVGAVLITIKDQGEGIHEDDLPRIWERLFRADKSRSKPGMGIGLSLVLAIARLHGGDAFAVSQPGRGSIFTLKLPKL
jgi:signal transduction histidine kinase